MIITEADSIFTRLQPSYSSGNKDGLIKKIQTAYLEQGDTSSQEEESPLVMRLQKPREQRVAEFKPLSMRIVSSA